MQNQTHEIGTIDGTPPTPQNPKKELVQIDAKEYGIPEDIASNIKKQFLPMLNKMEELEILFNEVVALPIDKPETAIKAKVVAQKYVKVRTGTAAIHKDQKEFYRKGGLYVDGWKNAQLFASEGKEKRLAEIVDFLPKKERDRVQKLNTERLTQLIPILPEAAAWTDAQVNSLFGEMTEGTWMSYFNQKKFDFNVLEKARAEAGKEKARLLLEFQLFESRRDEILPDWQYASNETRALNFGALSEQDWSLTKAAIQDNKTAAVQKQKDLEKETKRLKEENANLQAAARFVTGQSIFPAGAAPSFAPRPPMSEKDSVKNWISSFGCITPPNSGATVVLIEAKFRAFIVWANAEADKL